MKFSLRFMGLAASIFLSAASYAEQQKLTVIDEAGQPVANASILLGYEAGNPFPGNQLSTDPKGIAKIPADWKAALPVTVMAPGFVTSTLPVASPGNLTLQLSKQEPPNEFEIKGVPQDYGRLVTDGKVDFALMIPALTRAQLLAFDLATVLSPKVDVISILGNDVNLPSNIALPQQTENYIFPVEFNKPDYRLYVRNPGQYTVSAIHGQFPLQRVVNEIRAGKSMFELINHFTFLEGGQKDFNVQGNVAGADISVNQTPYATPLSVRAPAFANSQVMVSLAVVEKNGLLLPTDMKRFLPNQNMNLKTDAGGSHMVLSLLLEDSNALAEFAQPFSWLAPLVNLEKRIQGMFDPERKPQDFTKMSFALLPANGTVTPQFLPLANSPALNANVLSMQAPALPAGLEPVASYMVLSEIEVTMNGNVKSERRTRLWELWSNAWLNQVELPKITFNRRADRVYRWEVMFMARPSNLVDAGKASPRLDLNTITHVTRSALDI